MDDDRVCRLCDSPYHHESRCSGVPEHRGRTSAVLPWHLPEQAVTIWQNDPPIIRRTWDLPSPVWTT